MQWDSSPAAGFTSSEPWIDVPPSAAAINVAAQIEDAGSVLSYYKALIDARHRVPALTQCSFERIDVSSPALFVYRRQMAGSEVLVMVNLSGQRHAPLFSRQDEAVASLPWRLYLGNTEASQTTTYETGNHPGSEPTVATPLKPWEARVYLLAG